MASDGGPRAWAFSAAKSGLPSGMASGCFSDPVIEAAPFPVRRQPMADCDALAWGLLAEDRAKLERTSQVEQPVCKDI